MKLTIKWHPKGAGAEVTVITEEKYYVESPKEGSVYYTDEWVVADPHMLKRAGMSRDVWKRTLETAILDCCEGESGEWFYDYGDYNESI